nr:MAG: hypothetical protein H2Rhizo31543_000001 [Mitovirus sp.]
MNNLPFRVVLLLRLFLVFAAVEIVYILIWFQALSIRVSKILEWC